jgi:hypothetical protein
METGLSSEAMPVGSRFRLALSALALGWVAIPVAPVAAQDDSSATTAPTAQPTPQPRINLLVTVPRNEVNPAELQECRDEADAGTISGEIVVCREVGSKDDPATGTREETQKRYAEETALKGAPRAPEAFGIPNHGNAIGFGKPPPPAYIVDFDILPDAPAGSDADRIARGLPPLGEERELTEEEEKARREAAGIKTTVPPRSGKKRN